MRGRLGSQICFLCLRAGLGVGVGHAAFDHWNDRSGAVFDLSNTAAFVLNNTLESFMKTTNVYLITTAAAALLAGTVIAAAQGTQTQAPGSGAEQSPPSQGPGKQPKKEQPQTQGQSQTQGQGQQPPPGQAPAQPPQKEQTQKGQDKQGAQQKAGGSGGSVKFTTEQRTHIRTTVLQGSNAPRATNVNFSINVGTAVPTSVRIVAVPQVMIDVHPDWRGHMYFVVNDQIIIVDRNHKIVAVINV
ncbi:MAG: DUF1236 domain-containing protein [Rhizobiales bacterium]|nr:DUF1236 domain-containing protein [Hyphomicrobiales bacterium]